jgi:hypothetical protein
MSVSVEDISRRIDVIRRNVRSAESERDKKEGALTTLKKELETKFGVKTLEEAKALLAEKVKQRASLERSLTTTLEKIESEYELT